MTAKRKEEWVVLADDYKAEVVIDRSEDFGEGPIVKIQQDDDAVWLTASGINDLIAALQEALATI